MTRQAAGTPGPDPTVEETVSRLFWLVERLHDRFDEVAAEFGLTPTQAVALRNLSRPATMSQLAEQLGCEPSNVTAFIGRLEERKLVERTPGSADRRVRQVSLTPRGRRLRARFAARLFGNLPVVDLTAAQQTQLLDLLRVLTAAWPGPIWHGAGMPSHLAERIGDDRVRAIPPVGLAAETAGGAGAAEAAEGEA